MLPSSAELLVGAELVEGDGDSSPWISSEGILVVARLS
jgi:hypothetical protein